MKKTILVLCLVLLLATIKWANAQSGNSRNWVYMQQNMVGGASSTTSSTFSAFNSLWPFKYYSIAVSNTASGTSFDVRLEGSLDSINWAPILITNTVGGVPSFQSNAMPALYLRLKAHSLTSGKAITATAIGVP